MNIQNTLNAFQNLRNAVSSLLEEENSRLFIQAKNQNNWFTQDACRSAFEGIFKMLEPSEMENWLENYQLERTFTPKEIGILMAGNIPAVGFHDLMCVLLSGHKAVVKLSSTDSVLISWIIEQLSSGSEYLADSISVEPMLKNKDAYIATGSDNSSRYFDYYFGKYPHIIRKNRTSVSVLDHTESDDELQKLGEDIFTYFGLGCRNVSKIYIKDEAYLQRVLSNLEMYQRIADHHKYFNNYEYNKSIYLVNKTHHLDNGFLLLKEDVQLVSPIAVLYYEIYEDVDHLNELLKGNAEKIQCVVGKAEGLIPFGQAQYPSVSDYADGVDTMRFLIGL